MDQINVSDADKLRRRNRELSILNTIAEALNRSVDIDEALGAALARVAELLDLHTGWIWLLHEKTGQSYLAASQNLPPALANNPRRMEGSCYCLDTYRAGDLDGAANVNVVTCSRLWGLVDGTDGLRYHASIPLYAHGRELGVLNVASTDWRELTDDDLRLLYTIGDLLSIAIERARLYARSAEYGAAEERYRLAREIHDTLAQGLTGISMQLETAEALLESGESPQNIQKAIHQALTLTRANLEEARRSVLDLRAAPLEGRNLAEALKALSDEVTAENDLVVELEVTGAGRP
jgi:two-component system NarL family sensor kinase